MLSGLHAAVGPRGGGGANHRPVDAIFTMAQVCLRWLAFMFGCARFPPAEQGVVVMGAGVYHLLACKSMRQMGIRAGIAKAELQHRHAGNFNALAKIMHVGRDVSKILTQKWKTARSTA